MNNYYEFYYTEDGYIIGFGVVEEGMPYDFYGQMADYPEVDYSIGFGGWYKFNNNEFIEDAVRKQEMIDKKQRESTWEEKMEAQITYTAMMTDTLIEEEV